MERQAGDGRPHLASFVADFRRFGQQVAIVSRRGLRKQSATYSDLADLASRFAAELNRRGIHKGDRVLIWGENNEAWIAAFFGCLLCGVVAVPLDVTGAASFAQRVIREVTPRLITGGHDQLRVLRELGDSGVPYLAFEDYPEVLEVPPLEAPVDGLTENDPVQIVFTSGTTGEPKGIVHTHRNVLASLRPIEREIQKYVRYERPFHPLRFLHTLPLSHVFGQFMGIWIPALLAPEVHCESRLVPGDVVELIREERISVLAAVPRVLEILRAYLLNRFPNLDERLKNAEGLSAWRRWWVFRDVHRALGWKFWALVCGGATLPANIEHFWQALGLVVVQGYGMTETTALVSLNHPFHPAQGSIGKVLPGREIRLAEDGEILVRGETVAGATWEGGTLQARTSDWLATGDLGSIDESGNLRFRGRKKEVIVTASGLNIYPDDLEAALLRQPRIKSAVVVEHLGPNGSEPMAALISRDNGECDAVELATAVRNANTELAEYQQIRRWMIWPEPDFPRTPTGKILRREVAEALRNRAANGGAVPSPGSGLAGVIGRITREDVSHLSDSSLISEDLHLDSLGRVELQASLETQFGIEIDDAAYREVRTLGELKALTRDQTHSGSHDEYVFPRWPWSRVQSSIRSLFIELLMRPLVALIARPLVHQDADAVFAKPLLIVANHNTLFDVPLILCALPGKARRHVAVAMAGELLRDLRKARGQGNLFLNLAGPIQYFLAAGLFNVFPLPQLGDFRKSFAHAGRALDAGFHVLVFPEGRRSPNGLIQPFQRGAGMLWRELGTSALPVHLSGFKERIRIRAGKPIPFNPDREPADAARMLEEAVRRLEAQE